MTNPDYNLFYRLSRWASRQGENFLSESLAVTLATLATSEPDVASRVLHRLTAGFFNLSCDELAALSVRTQITTDSGRPDIEIRVGSRLAFIEVKDTAQLGDRQLERYQSAVDWKRCS